MIRGIGLRGAVAVNVITMVGIGPLITIPLVLTNLHGSSALVAWVVGGIIALCDGLVYCELGSLYPGSGSTYVFLRESFGRERWGRFFAFLFAWQFVISAPLTIATGYIGFAHYAGYLWAPLAANALLQGVVGSCIGIVTLVLLYRPIRVVGAFGIVLAGIALATLATLVAAAASRFDVTRAADGDPHAGFLAALAAGLGPSLVITLYDYAGYGASCAISDEVRAPAKTLPASVLIAIFGVGTLYLLLQLGVLGIVPWRELVAPVAGGPIPDAANYVASTVVERTWGVPAARVVTLAILATAFASTFGGLLAASRVPYAAAVDGVFLRPFARLHPRGRFPTVSLLVLGLLAIPPCFFALGDVINALTAGIVLVQAIAQLVALGAVRARGIRAPYRMWAYPLPALVALAGWIYIFLSSGGPAIAYGMATLGAGALVFFWRARRAAEWPFVRRAVTIGALAVLTSCACGLRAVEAAETLPQFGHARIVERAGADPVFQVDGKPFFVYGAAFFYERLPRESWAGSMRALAEMGINTLDLYVPWNWHELADGDFDFDGRTSPRRDLHEVLRLARDAHFQIILRPGPVIRNEWRNGGYPAWLLERPEYGMPLHDVLEGRYPATATLQNAHSDDAAAEWMRNATHVRYATRWLERVLRESAFVADRIVAVALDDDQGAYIDNQTYPAPNFQAYLAYLRDVVHGVTGPAELTFINTYQMKVTASSPVWAMGNWYQSDAYALGEHDRAQLEFSTGLLHTRPHQPMMASEFQAGWLQQPDDVRPRPADPSNTALAMATMIGLGVRGIVNFPAQDTLYPTGWEAPFANGFYAWDAALGLDGARAPRYAPTARVGAFVRRFGAQLAGARTLYDAAIAYMGAAYAAGALDNAAYGKIAAATIVAQQACRTAGLSCALVDPAFASPAELARYPLLIVPAADGVRAALTADVATALARYRGAGGRLAPGPATAASVTAAWRATRRRPAVAGIPGAAFALDPTHAVDGFLTVPNYGAEPLVVTGARIATARGARTLAPFVVPAHDALVAAVVAGRLSGAEPAVATAGDADASAASRLPVRNDASLPSIPYQTPAAGRALAYASDLYREGTPAIVLANANVRVVVAPAAGARAFVFQDVATQRNVFTSVGALRDDVAVEPPLSTTDRIAKYTHQFPAGTFNRTYRVSELASGASAGATFSYDAPDVVPSGARFERRLALAAGARAFSVDERVAYRDGPLGDGAQRAVSVTSLAVGDGGAMATRRLLVPDDRAFAADTSVRVEAGHALGYYDLATNELATIAWRAGDVEDATILERRYSIVVRLTLARGRTTHVRYGFERTVSVETARSALAAAERAAQ
ncbi:MAG: hypothetical protein NVSMB19_11670 [Vulcanimicrobiaceae bacterium]